jgi:hypothetical protein
LVLILVVFLKGGMGDYILHYIFFLFNINI